MAERRTKDDGLLGTVLRLAATGRLPVPGAQVVAAVNTIASYAAQQRAPSRPAGARPASTHMPRSAAPLARKPVSTRGVLAALDESPLAKTVAGVAAQAAARGPGALRGAWNMVKDIPSDVAFMYQLAPHNFFSPGGQAAHQQLAMGMIDLAGDAKEAVANPQATFEHTKRAFKDWRATIDSTATPQAPTLLGEMRRNWNIGLNQGDLAFDVASLLYGGAELKGLRGMRLLAGRPTAANYIANGVPKELADYFALPYQGRGHHYWPLREKLPAVLGGGPLPKQIAESPFFLLKPRGITNGEFYKLHHAVDPFYYGGKVKAGFPVRRWSAKELDWDKHGKLGRLVFGAPVPLKMAVTSPLYVGAGVTRNMLENGEGAE